MDVFVLHCNVFCYIAAFLVVWRSFLLVSPLCTQRLFRGVPKSRGAGTHHEWGPPGLCCGVIPIATIDWGAFISFKTRTKKQARHCDCGIY